jgi:hypothetical protein
MAGPVREGVVVAAAWRFPRRAAQVAAAADLLWRAVAELDCAGRVLAAANVARPASEDGSPQGSALARLWLAATVLREHRGDGHFAALAAADIDGCEAVVLRCGLDLRREDMQPIRGWTDEQWAGAHVRLADRGWVGPGGELTGSGLQAHDAVEAATDRAAARPRARLGADTAGSLAALLTPLAQACAALMPYPSPIGVPAPGSGVGPGRSAG